MTEKVPPYEPEGHPCHREGSFCAGHTYETVDGRWECIAHSVSWAVGRLLDSDPELKAMVEADR